ncbi:MAG: IclR family transcriptional regulator [Actinomycetota bacterium]|nr:IclR family transcriptional regulator [Actinomycetota bacterium]
MAVQAATSLNRGLAILFALGEGDELGVTRIAELVDREKSQVSRTLKVLAEHGLVERDPETLAYRVGWSVFALAAVAGEQRLVAAAPPVLRGLVRSFEEGAHLSVLQGTGVLTVSSEAPPHAVQAVNWIGRVVPAGCTSAGYALLLDHDREDLGLLLPDTRFRREHPHAPQSVDALWERVTDSRVRGWAIADEDFEEGLVAVAAPVRDFRGGAVAAINVSGPKFRFASRLEEAGEQVRASAEELSRVLGWDPARASILAY